MSNLAKRIRSKTDRLDSVLRRIRRILYEERPVPANDIDEWREAALNVNEMWQWMLAQPRQAASELETQEILTLLAETDQRSAMNEEIRELTSRAS
ncbi:MAG: hypothetical protein AB7K24_23235 [Gemmataceae bacterium]